MDPLGAWAERAADAELPLCPYMRGRRDRGLPYLRWLLHERIQEPKRRQRWPWGILKLHQLYKTAQRDFLRDLYEASSGTLNAERRDRLAWMGDEESTETWEVKLPGENSITLLADSIPPYSTAEPVRPEMLFALQVAVTGRLLVDLWSREERESGPYNRRAEEEGERHEAFTSQLAEALEILRPEYYRWHGNGPESLAGICEELMWIGREV